jgi:hypothetical protein
MTGSEKNRPPPLEFPRWLQPCEQCGQKTASKVLSMQAGLGNACAVCGRLRRGRPYLSKADLAAAAQGTIQTLKPARAKGENDLAKHSN